MKTKNNVQKAIFQSTTLVIGLVLLAFAVSAQGSTNELLVDNHSGAKAEERIENSFVKAEVYFNSERMVHEMEPSLELKNWMFANPGYTAFTTCYEEEVELSLVIDSWMLEDNWSTIFEQEKEAPLKIEDWMFSNFSNEPSEL